MQHLCRGGRLYWATDGRVEIAAYQPSWPECFSREKAIRRDALGKDVVGIEHVGSTSIEGSQNGSGIAPDLRWDSRTDLARQSKI